MKIFAPIRPMKLSCNRIPHPVSVRSPPSDKSTKDSCTIWTTFFSCRRCDEKRRIESARLATTGASPSPEIDTQKPKGKAATVLDQLRKAEKKEKHVDVLELARSRREQKKKPLV